jgi:hypothetical protein
MPNLSSHASFTRSRPVTAAAYPGAAHPAADVCERDFVSGNRPGLLMLPAQAVERESTQIDRQPYCNARSRSKPVTQLTFCFLFDTDFTSKTGGIVPRETAHTPARLQREGLLKIRNAQTQPCQGVPPRAQNSGSCRFPVAQVRVRAGEAEAHAADFAVAAKVDALAAAFAEDAFGFIARQLGRVDLDADTMEAK